MSASTGARSLPYSSGSYSRSASYTTTKSPRASANPDLGEASETLACEYGGGAIRIGLNPDYLTSFLAAVETERVRLELKDENSQCVGHPAPAEDAAASDEKYLCIIMPMRI